MRIGALVALSLTACRVSFDMPAMEVAHLAGGRVRDTTGEVVEVPSGFEAAVRPKPDEHRRLMAPRFAPPGTPVRAVAVPTELLSAAKEAGWVESEPIFTSPSDVLITGRVLNVRDDDGRVVVMPIDYIDHIEVTDIRMRRDRTIIIVIGSVVGAAAIIGSLAYGFSQLSFY